MNQRLNNLGSRPVSKVGDMVGLPDGDPVDVEPRGRPATKVDMVELPDGDPVDVEPRGRPATKVDMVELPDGDPVDVEPRSRPASRAKPARRHRQPVKSAKRRATRR